MKKAAYLTTGAFTGLFGLICVFGVGCIMWAIALQGFGSVSKHTICDDHHPYRHNLMRNTTLLYNYCQFFEEFDGTYRLGMANGGMYLFVLGFIGVAVFGKTTEGIYNFK